MAKRKYRPIHQPGVSREYKRACDAWKKATDRFQHVERLYKREQSINYDEFFLAQINYKSASLRFNIAFEKESRRVAQLNTEPKNSSRAHSAIS